MGFKVSVKFNADPTRSKIHHNFNGEITTIFSHEQPLKITTIVKIHHF